MKTSIKTFALILLLISLASSINMFNMVTLTNKNGASCMDGSPFAIYTYEPDPNDYDPKNKVLIMFQDLFEGWCVKDTLSASIPHCYRYLQEDNLKDWASSDNWSGSLFFLTGILSFDSYFADWYKVLIKTCDGGLYFGDNQVNYKSKTLHFKGRSNIVQAINYLNGIHFLQNRQEVVLAGSLNGALAAFMWADYIQESAKKAKVKIIADAAITINAQNQKVKTKQFQNRLKTIQQLFIKDNYYLLPNKKCQDANKDEIWQCFFSQNLINYMSEDISVYFTQSLYDGWAIFNILGFDCAQITGSLSQCTSEHRKVIDQYYHNVTSQVNLLVKRKNVNIFGIACVAHFFLMGKYDYDEFTVPMNTNNTVQNLVTNWVKNSDKNWTHIDTVQWPHNIPCSRKLQTKYLQIE